MRPCYAWIQQGDALEEQTLKTLEEAPFNRIRTDYLTNLLPMAKPGRVW